MQIRLTIQEQLELQTRDREKFRELCRTNPKEAKRIARERLQRCGILNEEGHFTPEARVAFGIDEDREWEGKYEVD